jgi:hypothetical protein
MDSLFVVWIDRFPQAHYSQCHDLAEKEFIASCIKRVSILNDFILMSAHRITRKWKNICIGLHGAGVREFRHGVIKRNSRR